MAICFFPIFSVIWAWAKEFQLGVNLGERWLGFHGLLVLTFLTVPVILFCVSPLKK